jgi:hemerythrin-like metal-binding protein
MELISWSDMLSTGVAGQDLQHKKLIDLINELNNAMLAGQSAEVTGKVLTELMNYTVFHFDYEEKLMAQYRYDDSIAHRAEHTRFVQTVSDFMRNYDSGSNDISVEILNFLRGWLTNHIMSSDKRLGQALAKLGVN